MVAALLVDEVDILLFHHDLPKWNPADAPGTAMQSQESAHEEESRERKTGLPGSGPQRTA